MFFNQSTNTVITILMKITTNLFPKLSDIPRVVCTMRICVPIRDIPELMLSGSLGTQPKLKLKPNHQRSAVRLAVPFNLVGDVFCLFVSRFLDSKNAGDIYLRNDKWRKLLTRFSLRRSPNTGLIMPTRILRPARFLYPSDVFFLLFFISRFITP